MCIENETMLTRTEKLFGVMVCEAKRLKTEKPSTKLTVIANKAIGRVASETFGIKTDSFNRKDLRDAIVEEL